MRKGCHGPMVKVCGLTREEDVTLAVELGAWAVGFVLAPSPRRVTPERVRDLVTAARSADRQGAPGIRPLTVGVFLDTPADEIAHIVALTGLSAVQLHAPEPGAPAVRKALSDVESELPQGEAAGVLVIQTVPVPAAGSDAGELREAAASVPGAAEILLFDTSAGGQSGGTGMPFPWAVTRQAAGHRRFLVAGGLSPQNIAEALAVSGAHGADVSSGVESAPGIKDPDLLRALFAAVDSISKGSTS